MTGGETSEGNASENTSLWEYLRAIRFYIQIKWFLLGGGVGFGAWGVYEVSSRPSDAELTDTKTFQLLNEAVQEIQAGKPIPDSVKTLLIDHLRGELDP